MCKPNIDFFLVLGNKWWFIIRWSKQTQFQTLQKFNKRRSRPALFSVNVAYENLVEKTKNEFYSYAKMKQKHLDGNLVERIPVNCFRVSQFQN